MLIINMPLGDVAREHFSKEGVYYIDLWPVSGLFLTVVSPNVANQIHANPEISMERPSLLPRFFKPICGVRDDRTASDLGLHRPAV